MININETLDLIKLKFYNEWLYTHVYDEGPSAQFHGRLTKEVVKMYIDPLDLPKDNLILDMGCGPGYFLDEMKERGYTNLVGISLSENDIKTCTDNGHVVKKYDFSFLPQKDGYYDESVDFIFCRQSLEHSPYPIFTLMEYNRVLKPQSYMYIEVPAPDGVRRHEFNANHYSVLGSSQWHALLVRTGFKIVEFREMEYGIRLLENGEDVPEVPEKCYCFTVQKIAQLDIK